MNGQTSWYLLIIALVGDFIVPYILALFYPTYRHKNDVMSLLGNPNSPVARWYNSWLVLLGVLMCQAGFKYYTTYLDISKNNAFISAAILILFGLGAGIIAGVFSVDERKKEATLALKIHGVGSTFGFIGLTFMPLMIGLLGFKLSKYGLAYTSLMFFMMSMLFFIFFVMSERDKYKGSLMGKTGLW